MPFRQIIGLIGLIGTACSGSTPSGSAETVGVAGSVPSQQQAGGAGAELGRAAERPPHEAVTESRAAATDATPVRDASSAGPSAVDAGMTLDSAPTSDDAGSLAPACDDCCPDGFVRDLPVAGARQVLGLTPSPEGVTVCPSGAVFLTSEDGQIGRASLDGSAPEPWATLSNLQPAGVACDERERLFVAIYGVRSGAGRAGVMRIDAPGAPAVLLPEPQEASPFASYNGVLAIPGLGVYATDSGAGWVVLFRETSGGEISVEVMARDILIANGLAYDPARRTLYVASSLGMEVLSFSVAADGALSARARVATSAAAFFDGVAVDEQGRVYAADYNGGRVIRLEDSLSIAELTNPASLAFRGGTLLVTDYRLNQPTLEGGLYAIALGACGALTLAR